jgi:hypothetical protein
VCDVFHKSTVAICTNVAVPAALSVKRLGVNKDLRGFRSNHFVQSKIHRVFLVLRHVRERIGY